VILENRSSISCPVIDIFRLHMPQGARQRLGEIDALQRFVQHFLHAHGLRPVRQGCAPVTAHQNDRNIGPQEPDLARELGASTRSGMASSVSTTSKRFRFGVEMPAALRRLTQSPPARTRARPAFLRPMQPASAHHRRSSPCSPCPRGSSRAASIAGLPTSVVTGSQISKVVPVPITEFDMDRAAEIGHDPMHQRQAQPPVPLPTPRVVKNGSNISVEHVGSNANPRVSA